MKKIVSLFFMVGMIFVLTGCQWYDGGSKGGGGAMDNVITYKHVNGHGEEKDEYAYILFEYEQATYVKYQVSYIACTCRNPDVNYYSTAYVEINLLDGSVKTVSYGLDVDANGNEGHYTAGSFGDSVIAPGDLPNWVRFQGFIENDIEGKSQGEITSIPTMHGEVDGYTGTTVSPNNLVRVLTALFDYHNENYGS